MSGTPFSGATAATFPINPLGRLPFYDPNASSTKYYSTPRQIASTFSPVVITLSGAGIVSDATGGLAYGATAPSGSTGQEVAINAALVAAYAASGGAGLTVMWDVAVALGAPIYIPGSYTTIICPNKGCGAILRSGANCPILRAPGTNANMTIAANTQKTFGQYDPSPPGGQTATNFRVFNQSYVNAVRLEVNGGTWNGNYPQNGQNNNATYGFNSTFQMWGVDGLRLFNFEIISPNGYGIHVLNCRDIEYGDLVQDGQAANEGAGGLQFNGPCAGIRGGHMRSHCGDDNIAFNADDGTAFGALVAGVNLQCGGDITDVVVEGPDIWNGTENQPAVGAMRFLSTYHRIDNVMVRSSRGQTSSLSFKIAPWSSPLCTGNGNVGRILLDDYLGDNNAYGGAGQGGANILVGLTGSNFYIESLEIRSRYRYNAQPYPDISVATDAIVGKLKVDWYGYQPAGASNNTQPSLLVAGTIGELIMTGSSTCNSSISTRASPLLRTATGASIARAILNVDGDFITNLVDHAAGTLTALIFSGGSHTNAGGGSPVAIASGLTIANLLYGNLVFKTGTAPFSGSGTATVSSATNLSYSGP